MGGTSSTSYHLWPTGLSVPYSQHDLPISNMQCVEWVNYCFGVGLAIFPDDMHSLFFGTYIKSTTIATIIVKVYTDRIRIEYHIIHNYYLFLDILCKSLSVSLRIVGLTILILILSDSDNYSIHFLHNYRYVVE